jgi:Uma2 family endonuclease
MAVPDRRPPMTAEELFELPDDGSRHELVEGELIPMTPAGARHGAIAVRVARLLDEYAEAHDLGVCGTAEPGFILRRDPDIVRAPGVSFVAKARIPATGIPTSYWPFAPDLAVEVVSPSDRLSDVHAKLADYFSAGARLVWVVQPETRVVYAYRSLHDLQVLGEDGELDGGEVLPGFRCPVKRLFP